MRAVWRLAALLWSGLLLAVAVGVAVLVMRWGVPRSLVALAIALLLTGVAVAVLIGPGISYRHWRYELRDQEIDLQHGIITITRTVIPMARVQHVDTRRGPLDRRFGLAGLVIYTAAGSSTIPGLSEETAGELRNRIAALANTRDDL
ncbi:MAG: PH domain-containing protein [Dehalococcoidia bacterium]